MRIAVWHNLPSGGGKRALYDHVAGLVSRGHHVEVWAPPTADERYLPLRDFAELHILPLEDRSPDTPKERLQLALSEERKIEAMDRHCIACAAEMQAGGFDILFANACQFYRSTAIGRVSSLPSAIYLGEPYRWLYEAMPNNRWAAMERPPHFNLAAAKRGFADLRDMRNARVQVREEIRNAKAFDRILCNSYFSRESIARAYGVDADVCYLGIDSDQFSPSSGPRAEHVIGLGALVYEKNVELCIRALAAMPPPRPPLVWIGNYVTPGYLDSLRTLAEELDVEFQPRIRVGDEELKATLSTARAMIYAPRLEPFGLAPLEASACGVPVVAAAEGGVRETVRDEVNGLIADATPKSLAAALTRVLYEPGLAPRLGAAGRKLVEGTWSKETAIDRLISHFQAILARRGKPGVAPSYSPAIPATASVSC